MKFQLSVFQGVDEAFDDRQSLGHLGFISRANLEVAMRLEFVRTLTERLPQAFTKLKFGFALCRITIRESLLADVVDGRQNFLKLVDPVRDFFDGSGFRSGPLMFGCARSCHGGVKKSSRGADTWQENNRF